MLPLESDSPQRPLERINAEYKRVIDLAAKNENAIEKAVHFQSMPKISGFVVQTSRARVPDVRVPQR